MKTLKLLTVIFLVAFTSCDSPLSLRRTYTVSGTLYDYDEVTPVAGASLYLEGEASGFRTYYEIIAETTTDENGYFELTYKHNRQAHTLRILGKNESGLLYSIPKNEDYQRDICGRPVGYLDLTINVERELAENDTIIIYMHNAAPVTTHFEGKKNYVIHPFDELENFHDIKTEWNRGISTQRVALRWGVGHKDFREKGYEIPAADGYPVNYEQITIEGFPYTDRDTITVE